MTYRDSTGTLTIDGVRINVESAGTLHGVENPIGQMAFTVRTPLPVALSGGTGPIGKRVVLTGTQASHDGIVNGVRSNFRQEAGVIFSGTIRGNQFQSDPSGRTRTFRCQDDLWMFGVETYEAQAWDGPILANKLIRGQLESKGYGTGRRQAIFLDTIASPAGVALSLGGQALVDDGQVVLRDGSSQLALMRNIAEVYGYALYALPTGNPRLSRVMGIPPAVGVTDLFRADGGFRTINSSTEGFSFRGADDADEVVNYVEVRGASWTAADGTAIDIRSFPASVAYTADLPEDVKVRHLEFSSPYILTQAQADGARQIREQDLGGRARTVTIELDGMPTCYPGHVHKIVAPDLGLNETYYVMTVVHAIDARGGFRTTVTYRRGAGTARPAGVDNCVFRSLFTAPIHVGDEYVGWYAVPNTQGQEKAYTFTPTVDQTALAFVARAHGCNSQYTVKPPPEPLTGSKVLIEQLKVGGVSSNPSDWERIGENELPVLDERYTERRFYPTGATPNALVVAEDGSSVPQSFYESNWTDIKVPIPGTYVAGRLVRATVISGTDGVGRDDFELKNASVMSCEEGQPTLPNYPRPAPPTPPRQQPGTTLPGGVAPAKILLNQGGQASPAAGLRATKSYVVPQGATTLRMEINALNLQASTGTIGAGWSEGVVLSLRAPGGGPLTSQQSRWLVAPNTPQAGDGPRYATFDISAKVAAGPREIDLQYTYIFSEIVTITAFDWVAIIS